jgi:hypothetical protein
MGSTSSKVLRAKHIEPDGPSQASSTSSHSNGSSLSSTARNIGTQGSVMSVPSEGNRNITILNSSSRLNLPAPGIELTPSSMRVPSQLIKATPVSPVNAENRPKSMDMRLHGNEVFIGGCWGTIDLTSAVDLKHKMRSTRPPPHILTAFNEIPSRLRERQEIELSLRTVSPERFPGLHGMRGDVFGKFLV